MNNGKIHFDKGGFAYAMIIMDLLKAFDTMNQELLTTKSGAYEFQKNALSFKKSYLTKRQQRARANSKIST